MTQQPQADDSWYTPISEIAPLVERLRKVSQSFQTHSIEWRRSQLEAVLRLVQDNTPQLQAALKADMGQGVHYCELFELATIVNQVHFCLEHLPDWMAHKRVATPFPTNLTVPVHSELTSYPRGVVLLMSPWNFPVALVLNPLINALAAGNCCLVKPSEISTNTSRLLGRLISEYLDPEAIAVVQGNAQQSTELLKHRWDAIAYTGGLRVAKIVATAAAQYLTPLLLELGGKTPAIVLEDAQVEAAAARIAWGKFAGNCGQFCVTPDYVLVHETLQERFVACLKQQLVDFYGDNPYTSQDYGRMVSVDHAQRVIDLIDDQCKVLHGDQRRHLPKERYVEPTIVEATPSSKIMQEEIFGPVLVVMGVKSMEAAVQYVNQNFNHQNHHPLALYVFSQSKQKQRYVLDHILSGMACVNHVVLMGGNFHLPFGGVGYSGMGSYYGKHGFDFFSHQRGALVTGNHSSSRLDPGNWIALPPYSPAKTTAFQVLGQVPVYWRKLSTWIPILSAMLVYHVLYILQPSANQVREFNLNTIIQWVEGIWSG